ncbi:protein-L-histidine N-pros-methyltransferase [Cherax quadricarinatus]|uniref:protein-L-histidine N-pros-methyltransferase n=1 Tax=Cherax quadricarinatus TaxID=27406 RepID=UPI0023787EC9|nr:protein-L-histidine N-pros-methyltransferase-like [Cherax quadricarinatus]
MLAAGHSVASSTRSALVFLQLLSRGRMFVWSEAQARRLLGRARADTEVDGERKWLEDQLGCPSSDQEHTLPGEGLGARQQNEGPEDLQCRLHAGGNDGDWWVGERLLDLGAGDGYVTRILAAGARQIDVTEASVIMRHRLRERGYRVLDAWSWMKDVEDAEYDVVTCLNLLDRCDTPRTLLTDIHAKLASHGALVIALVLPFSPYVEIGTIDNLPSEELGVTGSNIESQVNSLAKDVFPSLGYKLERWSRLPYLCEGDLDQAFYWLSDVVLVLSKVDSVSADMTLDGGEEHYSDALDQVTSGLGQVNIEN